MAIVVETFMGICITDLIDTWYYGVIENGLQYALGALSDGTLSSSWAPHWVGHTDARIATVTIYRNRPNRQWHAKTFCYSKTTKDSDYLKQLWGVEHPESVKETLASAGHVRVQPAAPTSEQKVLSPWLIWLHLGRWPQSETDTGQSGVDVWFEHLRKRKMPRNPPCLGHSSAMTRQVTPRRRNPR